MQGVRFTAAGQFCIIKKAPDKGFRCFGYLQEGCMKFWKMNGAGNDFILINNIEEKLPAEVFPKLAATVCERHLSIGADGFMVVDRPSEGVEADYRMLFYNSDGSGGEMCGNGARCICRYGYETGLAGERPVIETTAGIVTGERIDEELYRIRLNDPTHIELEKEIKLDAKFDFWKRAAAEKGLDMCLDSGFSCRGSYILLGEPGSPHLIVEYKENVSALCGGEHLKDADEDLLRELGRALRFNSALPKGANVSFVEVTGDDKVFERTFERGVEDFTYACGTGTGSAVTALTLLNKVSGNNVKVTMTGGDLYIDVEEIDEEDNGNVSVHGLYLTGPTNIAAMGEITDVNVKRLIG